MSYATLRVKELTCWGVSVHFRERRLAVAALETVASVVVGRTEWCKLLMWDSRCSTSLREGVEEGRKDDGCSRIDWVEVCGGCSEMGGSSAIVAREQWDTVEALVAGKLVCK